MAGRMPRRELPRVPQDRGSNNWSLIGNLPTPAVANPPATVTADPTGGSTTNTTGGGMQVQSTSRYRADGRHRLGARFVPPTSQDAHETAWEQNPNFLTAMNALGMTSVGTDASKPYPNPATSLFGIGVGTYTGATYPAASPFPDGTLRGRAAAPDQHLLQQLDREAGGRRVQHALRRAAGRATA